MRTLTVLTLLYTLGVVAGFSLVPTKVPRDEKPDGKLPEGTTDQCTYYYTTSIPSDTCSYIEGYWGITHDKFVRWNPVIGDDCSGLEIGYSYCVDVNNGGDITTAPASTSTGSVRPSPMLDGTIQDCDAYHYVVKGDTCDSVTSTAGITIEQFIKWNAAVENDCSGLWAKYYVCVAADGFQPPATSTSDASPTGSPRPSPTLDGTTEDCDAYHYVEKGDTCDKIISDAGITMKQFMKWNPNVESDCTGLWANYYYCMSIKGIDPVTTTTTTTANGPSPTQPGIVGNCERYYKVQSGDTCQAIVDKTSGLTLDSFLHWNPSINSDCSDLWVGYYYCTTVSNAFRLRSYYHADCGGNVYNDVTITDRNDGHCIDTNCQAASVWTDAEGFCPDGEVQISYWEEPGCIGKWFGYGYMSRGSCHTLWTEGWKFKALHLRCARSNDDCVNRGACTYDPEPSKNTC